MMQVSAACTAWVAQAAAVVAAAGGGLLASCTDAAALLAVQASVLDSIATWSSAGSSGSSSDARDVPQGSTAVAAGRGKNSGLVAGRDLRAAAAGGASGGSSSSGSGRPWAGVCQEVLGRPLSVWQVRQGHGGVVVWVGCDQGPLPAASTGCRRRRGSGPVFLLTSRPLPPSCWCRAGVLCAVAVVAWCACVAAPPVCCLVCP